MPKTVTVRIAAIVTADGRWSAQGSHNDKPSDPDWSPDWAWLDEMCDYENATVCPQRVWITAELPVPEMRDVKATSVKIVGVARQCNT